MTKEWYWLDAGASNGPIDIDELAAQCHRQEISTSTLVWRMGQEKWMPLGEVLGGLGKLPPPLPESTDAMSLAVAPPPTSVGAMDQAPSHSPAGLMVEAPDLHAAPQIVDGQTWTDAGPHPWRRYFARMIDSTINGLLVFFVVEIIWSIFDGDSFQQFVSAVGENQVANVFVTLLAAIPANALLIGLTGSSAGKWFFGVRVLGSDHRPIGFPAAISREVAVWVQGLGLGIPLVILVAMLRAYGTLTKSGMASWDRSRKVEILHRQSGTKQVLLSATGVILLVTVVALLQSL